MSSVQVKLADVLSKFILPVNFLETWPPKCLAIQFATTQFIPWKKPSEEGVKYIHFRHPKIVINLLAEVFAL